LVDSDTDNEILNRGRNEISSTYDAHALGNPCCTRVRDVLDADIARTFPAVSP